MTSLFAIVGMLVASCLVYAFMRISATRRTADELVQVGLARARISALRDDFLAARKAESDYLQKVDARDLDDFHRGASRFREDLEAYTRTLPPEDRGSADELGKSAFEMTELFEKKSAAVSSKQPGDDQKYLPGLASQSTAVEASIGAQLEQWGARADEEMKEKAGGLSAGFQGTYLALAIFLAVVAVGMTVTFTGGLNTFRTLAQVTGVVSEIGATGSLDRRLGLTRTDEVGQLAQTLDQLVASLRTMVQQMQEATANLSSAGAQIQAATAEQSASSTEQAASISEATTTVEEIRQTAEQAAERAQEMIGLADRSEQVSQTGTQAVAQSVQGINDVRERVDSIATNILKLSERTQQVGDIIATVTELAERSNLLAVNASIEAAKAGEHGRGFAVVAREVHSLADQSKAATRQIRTILNEIQAATNEAVMVTEDGTKRAEAAVRQAEQAGTNIRELAQAIQVTAQASRQIAASSRQQSVGIDQIVLAFKHINEATNESVAGARQTEASAGNLKELSEKMRALVVRYRL